MDDTSLKFLKTLLGTPGPSSYEIAPARLWRTEAGKVTPAVRGDVAGNSYATIAGTGGPSIMLAGHIDEIGVIITHIDDQGYLSFDGIGGWDAQVFVGQRVTLLGRGGHVTGVVGKKAIHLMDKDEREKVSKIEDLWIDIGATTRAEAEAHVRMGDAGVLAAGPLELPNGRLVSRSLDNRVGAFVVLEALRLLKAGGPAPATVTAVATTREEISHTGRRRPHLGIRPRGRGSARGGRDSCHRLSRPRQAEARRLQARRRTDNRPRSVPEHHGLRPAHGGRRGGEDPVHDRGGVTRHPHRCGGDLQQPPGRGHGTGVGAAALHAQPE